MSYNSDLLYYLWFDYLYKCLEKFLIDSKKPLTVTENAALTSFLYTKRSQGWGQSKGPNTPA